MPSLRPTALALLAYAFLCTAFAQGEPRALIVIGTTGSSSIADDLLHTADTIRDALVQRGFSSAGIELLSAQPGEPKITRETVLARLKARENLSPSDEFWLVLLGFSGSTDDDETAFQVSGPRLKASELKAALDAIPAHQFVFVGTSDSGGFVPVLMKSNRDVLAATEESGEIDLPRFPESWAEALKENSQGSWKELAARAAETTLKIYTDGNLAVSEHARLGDAASGKILEAPFGLDKVAEPVEAPTGHDHSMALINASDIKVEIHKPNSEWETQPATAATRKLIAEAKAAPNPDGFNAVMLQQQLGYRIGDDQTEENSVLRRIYIAREDAVWRWANYELPQDPPAVTTKLIAARIIQPDGSSTVFNPTKMPEASDCSSGLCGALTAVFIPGAHAGCLVEISYRTRRLLDAGLPQFSEEMPVQQDIPVLSTQVQLQIPSAGHVHFKLRNLDQKPVETDANGIRTLSWNLRPLPGYEGLPYDPPQHDMIVALDISSLDSWDQFASWYRRLSRGSDEQDATVKAKADELAGAATSRVDKIRKAYEFVSSLRYVAIEFGINGIRPRSPSVVLQNRYGDCKDKANLLIALLADMGVDARFCLLNRGSSTDTTFPSWQFNHAIAYVPKAADGGQPDDLWLDTTDSTAPFPTLSPGDMGRSALVFNGDTSDFRTVTSAREEGAAFDEHWKLEQQDDGHWSGKLQTTWGGLAEYEMRASVRGLSPRQRDFDLQSLLTKQLPDGDFSQLNLTAADDLSTPLKLATDLQLPAIAYPQPAFDAAGYFAPPERNRPLLLNNGQNLHVLQTVDVVYRRDPPPTIPPPFEGASAGFHATAQWQRVDDHTFRRTAELQVSRPLVASTDYSSVRQLLREWTRYLSH